jgi:exodeoxyribonuclease VII small subunit
MAENKSASFEASLERLQEIVKELESEGIALERSVQLYREGRELVQQCETMLRTAEETLRGVTDGTTPAQPGTTTDLEDDRLDDEISF